LFYFPADFRPCRVTQSISTIDLLPTFAEIANDGKAPNYAAPIDGRSLLAHLSGTGGHDEVLGEYFGEGAIAPLLMIRRGNYKYVRSASDPEQLFDLVADPVEQVNLAQKPGVAKTLADFRTQALATWDESAMRTEVIASQRRRLYIKEAMKKGRHTSWDFQPFVDASSTYMRNHLEIDDLELTRVCRELQTLGTGSCGLQSFVGEGASSCDFGNSNTFVQASLWVLFGKTQ